MANELPSLDYLNELFDVDFEAGVLYWKERPLRHFKNQRGCNNWNAKYAGKEAGSIEKYTGYKNVGINYVLYLQHRIIYYMYHKECPVDLFIDHIDGNRANNSINNLRLANRSENNCNKKKAYSNNKGTCIKNIGIRQDGKYYVYVFKDGKIYSKYGFTTLEEAIIYKEQLLQAHHGDFKGT